MKRSGISLSRHASRISPRAPQMLWQPTCWVAMMQSQLYRSYASSVRSTSSALSTRISDMVISRPCQARPSSMVSRLLVSIGSRVLVAESESTTSVAPHCSSIQEKSS